MDSSWYMKTSTRSRNEPIVTSVATTTEEDLDLSVHKSKKKTETLNAFHIIALSEGFDLSPLFDEKKKEEKREMRFATSRPASSVISSLEDAARAGNKFDVRKSESRVRIEGKQNGRKGKLAVEAEIFTVSPSFVVVEVKKDHGDVIVVNPKSYV